MAKQGRPPEVDISAREAEVLAALGEHLTNAEIGARLFISIRTVGAVCGRSSRFTRW
ncbi:MAG: LuxR C-terminal-related transcriptional regulator, partial [Streptosporangiaceae bacterium]